MLTENQKGKRQYQCFHVGALQFASDDPRLQVVRNDFEQFAEMFSEEFIYIFAKLQRAELHQTHEIRTISQSSGDEFEGTAQRGPSIIGFRHSRKQIATQLHFGQLRLKGGAVEISLSAKIPVDRDLVNVCLRSDFPCAGAVIPMAREESRCGGKNPLLRRPGTCCLNLCHWDSRDVSPYKVCNPGHVAPGNKQGFAILAWIEGFPQFEFFL